jgi:hypothetical protein
MMDFLKSASEVLATIAPTIASAMGGPLAGMATTAVIGALGLAPETPQKEVIAALSTATPEQLMSIKAAEQQFLLDMKKLEISVHELHYKDRDSARQREIQAQDSWTPRILAAAVIGLYIGVQWYILGHIIDSAMKEVVMRSLGTLDAAVGLILGYYFGSSVGSSQKNDQIRELINK